jgi:glycosyltransferase involved in cell wall biosynthesis
MSIDLRMKDLNNHCSAGISVLHVMSDMDPVKGGVCQSVRTMIAGLSELGVTNEVLSLDNADAAYIQNDNFIINATGEGKGPWRYNPAYMHWLQNNIDRFDGIIVHGLWLYHGYCANKALIELKTQAVKSKIPKLFIMPHGMLDPYFQQAGGRKLKALRNWLYWKVLERRIVNNADGLFFTCIEEKRLAKKPFKPYLPKKEIVVGLGVEEPPPYTESMTEKFREKCALPINSSYLLFLSRIHQKKGLDLLIDVYKKIIENRVGIAYDDKNIIPKLVIAGPGLETEFGVKIKTMIENSSELKSMVYFTGMLTGEAKWGAFYGCEAFILPSHQENFGIAVVEALACRKAALISNQVNIWPEIKAANAGMVASDTTEGTTFLVERWNKLNKDEKLAMGQMARECFEKHFAIAKAAREVCLAFSS